MQNTTKQGKKKAAILIASVAVAILGVILIAIFLPLLGLTSDALPLIGLVLIYGALIAAVIIGVLLALCQRLQEIEGGEEEDAKKY